MSASKAALLSGLEGGAAAQKGAPPGDTAGAPAQPQRGWDVLQDDFAGLSGRAKLKDWDKAGDSSGGEDGAPSSDSDSDDE